MAATPTISLSLPTISLQASPSSPSSKSNHIRPPFTLTMSSLFGTRIAIQTSSSSRFLTHGKYWRATFATMSLSLPSTISPDVAPEKLPKWSSRSIRAYALGQAESMKFRYRELGTQSLLMGILIEGTSKAAKFLRANGYTLTKVKMELISLLGRSNYFHGRLENLPLSEQAQRALDWAVEEKLKSGDDGEITVSYMLLGIWSQKDSAGHKALAALGFNDEKAKEVATFMNDGDVDLSFKQQF